ncbi:hypothetical protein [Aminipila sp.]|uniref:hypothetical protein n=1 Tax=Aminipila sp. TaxID=2060095 RepID=UPI00289CE7B5|nr:hypothetical protein [Aminipila sp.]
MKKFLNSKIMTLALATALVFGMSTTAFASDSDPNMTDYMGQFTTVVNAGDIGSGGYDVELMAGPANSSWIYTGFSTEAAAENVDWSVVDGSIAGVAVDSSMALEVDTNEYVSYAVVHIDSGVTSGSASILATNNANGASVNFTVLVNPSNAQTTPASATFEIYAPGATTPSTTGTTNVNAGDYISNTNFVTVMDGMPAMVAANIIDNYAAPYGYVSKITVNNTPYEPAYPAGWQYRVYRETATAGTYKVVGISAVLGADDIQLQSGDIVQWRAGNYDADLFPETIVR